MNKMIKAAICRQFGESLVIEEISIPEVNVNQILMKLIASGVCHTDLHAVNGDWLVVSRIGG